MPSSSPFNERAWLRIQKIIHVSKPAAAKQMMAKTRDRAPPVRSSIVTCRIQPMAMARSDAAPVPYQTQRASSGCAERFTAARTIATTSAASNPSRSVISKLSPMCKAGLTPGVGASPSAVRTCVR